ncbi:hypothetical protein [Halochromatium roseum]|uniref:hypothetical protein n=1 Tax=Halochromatium roseum TaxID=391920 RepID=UPI001912C3A7|nr:hypothetical protein [Halochromatium roseum]
MKQCTHCGDWFVPKFSNANLCYSCWQKREVAFHSYDRLIDELHELRAENADLKTRSLAPLRSIPPELIPKLIRLCHPDRHGGSAIANDVTRWLLEQRGAAA